MRENPLVVIKVGTTTLMKVTESGDQRVNLPNMGALVDTVTSLRQKNIGVIIVTSAAVGFGCLKLKLKVRPTNLATKQAVAAAGQSSLIRMYEDLFAVNNIPVAQVLLSRFDFSAKDRYSNVRNALTELLRLGVVPIINENDTVSTEELRFGDNDTLSALVAVGVAADKLFLLTDVDSLFTSNPRTDPSAVPVLNVSASELIGLDIGGSEASGGQWGTGGMATKIIAARTAVCAGIETILAHGAFPTRVSEYMTACMPLCTVFHTAGGPSKMTDHRRWLLALPVRGQLALDAGASSAVLAKTSLFAAGIVTVTGKFLRDECVSLVNSTTGVEIGRALTNFDAKELDKIKGLHSDSFFSALGFHPDPEVAYRSNIIIMG